MRYIIKLFLFSSFFMSSLALADHPLDQIPADIKAILDKPLYKDATWGIRVVDADTDAVLIDYNTGKQFYIGSVRKIFSVGELLNEVGPDYRTTTKVHTDGTVKSGELKGNLILVASGDITMGGRTNSAGKIAFTTYDHNEATAMGNTQIVQTDPLAGYKKLAMDVKRSGINKISGDVVIDDRLFEPFNFLDQFKVTPMFVNDDVIDVSINPGKLHEKAKVDYRPKSAAFSVINHSMMVDATQPYSLELSPLVPECFGKMNCSAEVKNDLPINFVPPFTKKYPIIQTFRISKPSNYARTIFIEALAKAGVDVSAVTLVKENPADLLKNSSEYNQKNQVAELKSLPYREHAKLILKVSYNLGADMSLMLFGLTQGVRTMEDSLRVERETLAKQYGIASDNYHFMNGGGMGYTTIDNKAVTDWLGIMRKSKNFPAFYDALPVLAYDGTLGFVDAFKSNRSLIGAVKQAHAKPGTFIVTKNNQLVVEGQAFAGYIDTKKKRHLIYHLVVNNVPIPTVESSVEIFQDQGIITAILWRDY